MPEDDSVPSGKIVGQNFDLIATDESGSTTMNATVVVSRNEGPVIKAPLIDQVDQLGNFSAPSSLLSYPSTDFLYVFDPDTFQHGSDSINYYAVSGDGSPLPSWVDFDGPTLTFNGRTPRSENLIQPPQKFDFQLIASDIVGFAGVSLRFSMVVGNHKLTADNPILELKASRGSKVAYKSLAEEVKLDGKIVGPKDLKVSTDNLPKWLSFDTTTWILSGSPQKDDRSTNFTILFEDSYTDQLQIMGSVDIQTHLFETTFDTVEVTPGADFDFDLKSYFKDPEDIEVSISTESDQEWLSLKELKLQGKVPKSVSGELEVTVKATSKASGLEESENLTIAYLAPDGRTTTLPSATSTKGPKQTDEQDGSEMGHGHLGSTAVLLAIVIPVLAIALVIMVISCLVRRRRARRSHSPTSKPERNISNPVVGSLQVNGSQASIEQAEAVMVSCKRIYKLDTGGYATVASQLCSEASNSHESMSSGDDSHTIYLDDNEGVDSSQNVAETGREEDGRQSWITIDPSPANMRSGQSTRSRHSDITVPISTHQLLPTPPFLSENGRERTFRSTDPAPPSRDGLAILPHGNLSYDSADPSDAYTNVDVFSTMSTSSAALPYTRHDSPKAGPSGFPSDFAATNSKKSLDKSGSDKDWSTVREESEEKLPDLPRQPEHSYTSSNQWPIRPRTADASRLDRQSFRSDISFGSAENWRVFNHGGPSNLRTSASGPRREPAENITSLPQRPSTAGTGAMRNRSIDEEFITPDQWHAPPAPAPTLGQSPQGSRLSRLNNNSSQLGGETNWRREDSGKASDGSFVAFI